MDRTPGPLEGQLSMTVYGPNSEVVWHQQVRAIPRIGEHILMTDPARAGWTRGGTVKEVFWNLGEGVAGQHVGVFLDEITEKPASGAETGGN